ncbi:unnamed protein product [Mytilus coruscus]|uniref:Uncharacterized protein n=1 Tax=Mytilus coruscus TaxID=42192 RepID=A0A6J8AZY8_MYTCO|nr:unnamed protein product [Mytilus coruscus]
MDNRGVMLDDQYSCLLIEQNVFYNRMPYQSNIWRSKYPKLALTDANDTIEVGNPEGNETTENIFCSKSVPAFNRLNKYGPEWFNVKNNIYISDDFQAPLYGNFKPMCLLEQFVSEKKFEDPVMASDCRPRGPIATRCWFVFKECSNQSKETFCKKRTRKSQTFYLDTEDKSDTDENVCLNRVSEMRQKCGTGADFAVIYGPTGAMTLGGDDCYFAWYGCPKLGEASRGRFQVDKNCAKDEATCLSRAVAQWRYCGSNPSFPVFSIYSPTGQYRAVGAGCWIKIIVKHVGNRTFTTVKEQLTLKQILSEKAVFQELNTFGVFVVAIHKTKLLHPLDHWQKRKIILDDKNSTDLIVQ